MGHGRGTALAALLAALATMASVVAVAGPAATITPGPGLSPILGNVIFPVRQNSFLRPGTTGFAGPWFFQLNDTPGDATHPVWAKGDDLFIAVGPPGTTDRGAQTAVSAPLPTNQACLGNDVSNGTYVEFVGIPPIFITDGAPGATPPDITASLETAGCDDAAAKARPLHDVLRIHFNNGIGDPGFVTAVTPFRITISGYSFAVGPHMPNGAIATWAEYASTVSHGNDFPIDPGTPDYGAYSTDGLATNPGTGVSPWCIASTATVVGGTPTNISNYLVCPDGTTTPPGGPPGTPSGSAPPAIGRTPTFTG
jgi:hypothetical protein